MNRFKYPRTPHLPWSEGRSADDTSVIDCDHFGGREVVMSEKIDGEATTMYRDHIHARSIDSKHHPSRNWVKTLHASMRHYIPEGMRVCGENVYAHHSIYYEGLPSYFLCYGVYDENNVCLSWDDTLAVCEILGLETVPVIYRGPWDEAKIKGLWTGQGAFTTFALEDGKKTPTAAEGYVVRLADSFNYHAFGSSVAKWVRKNHIQTDEHWMAKAVVPNRLKNE